MSKVSSANQHTPDDREQRCWDLYVKSIEKGVPNAKKAAIAVGYSKEHADNITLQGWFKGRMDKLRRSDMVSKAEKNLDKALETDYRDANGDIRSDVMRIVMDVSKTVVTTLGKDEGYSTRSELTGKDGNPIEIHTEQKELINKALDEL